MHSCVTGDTSVTEVQLVSLSLYHCVTACCVTGNEPVIKAPKMKGAAAAARSHCSNADSKYHTKEFSMGDSTKPIVCNYTVQKVTSANLKYQTIECILGYRQCLLYVLLHSTKGCICDTLHPAADSVSYFESWLCVLVCDSFCQILP